MYIFISLSIIGLIVISLANSIIDDTPKNVTIKTIIIMEAVFGISSIISAISL